MVNSRARLSLLCAALLVASGTTLAQVDFSRYVALGDSLTAGVSSFGSVEAFQKASYPALIAQQAGVSGFQQPLVGEPGIPALLELKALELTSQGVSPTIAMKAGIGMPLNATYQGVYNNLGIDGAYVADMLTLTGDITRLAEDLGKYAAGQVGKRVPLGDLVLRDGVHTPIQFAIAAQPTFVTVFIGNNDALGAAQTGVAVDGVTLTTVAAFTQSYDTLLNTLRGQLPNAKLVVATLPDCTSAPFVTTVKPYLINPSNGSHIPLIGESGLLTENDYVLLTGSALIKEGLGVPVAAGGTGLPLPEGSVDQTGLHAGVILRAAEAAAVNARIAAYNEVIKARAAAVGAKVVDLNAFLKGVQQRGVVVGGITLTSSFLTGGLFSYDGFHLQKIGYAVVANEFIKVINQGFGASLPLVNLEPLLLGTRAATSVAAADFVMSPQVAAAMVKASFPGADVSRLGLPRHPVRRRLTGRPAHEALGSGE